jgi:hypothetical protein
MATPASLLETYFRAKDGNHPELMRDVFAPDAVLTFSISTDAISFPERTEGLEAITHTLVTDFRKKYTRCRSYYVCEQLNLQDRSIEGLPWLVLMQDVATGHIRIGTGRYDWHFGEQADGALKVRALHILIEKMDVIDNAEGTLLGTMQSALPYPWLPPATLHAEFDVLAELEPTLEFIDGYKWSFAVPG